MSETPERLGERRRFESLEACERLIREAIFDADCGLDVRPTFEGEWGKTLQAARLALGMEPYIPGRYLEEDIPTLWTGYAWPVPYYVARSTLEEFIIGMLGFGIPLDVALVGSFDSQGRGSRRDIDLPLHRDGEYSEELAQVQGGMYVEKKGIDVVGLYCIRAGKEPCVTLVGDDEIDLREGQALVLDNRLVMHGRKGPVGERLLVRMWVQKITSDSGPPNEEGPMETPKRACP